MIATSREEARCGNAERHEGGMDPALAQISNPLQACR